MSAGEEKQQAAAEQTVQEAGGLLGTIIDRMPERVKKDKERVKDLVQNLVDQLTSGIVRYDRSLSVTIHNAIEKIDEIMSKQLAAIMHHPKFEQLEGAWRGLHYLVDKSETCSTLKIKVLQATKREVSLDLANALEFDQSETWKRIYEREFGQAGGEAYGAMIANYEFENHPEDIALLENMGMIGAASFCPFVAASSPALFGLDSFTDLEKIRDLETCFAGPDYIPWKSFRESPHSRFVVLTMPRVLARYPYSKLTNRIDSFDFQELAVVKRGKEIEHTVQEHDKFCWMNSAFALGARLTDSFSRTNWCTSIRGYENGGKVEGLPNFVYTSEEGDREQKVPTEVLIPDRRNAEFSKLGFLPLVHHKNSDFAVFMNGDTTHKPQKWDNADKTANERISARLPYIMAVSRISHYFKEMGRRLIGQFKERKDIQDYMDRWIAQYVLGSASASDSQKAQYPLAEAKIEVTEDPANPGSYSIVALLRPWLQVEELNASMRLVARIPQK
jgi:type VI secretion system protein ImpC